MQDGNIKLGTKLLFGRSFQFLIAVFVFLFLAVILSLKIKIFAQEDCDTMEECQTLLEQYQKEISGYEQNISKTQQDKKTLQNQIYILKNKTDKLNLQIKESGLMVKDLNFQIKDTESSIGNTISKTETLQEKLAGVLRVIDEEDKKSLIEILFKEDKISGFFDNLVALAGLSDGTKIYLEEIAKLRETLENQKGSLEKEKDELENLLTIQQLQKNELSATKTDREKLLAETKGKESAYQKLLTETQKKANEIRARIFELIGVPEAPTFGEAVDIAKHIENMTGIRPALLLAVLTQESNIGKNVGQCYLTNINTGSGVRIQTGAGTNRVMKPDGLSGRKGDIPYFLQITQELGRDYAKTPVSCPMSYGWGGAMGPAQFIPSTWALYKDDITAMIGKTPDPWYIRDAFLAAALYLKKYGADSKNYNDEWKAAMIYFSGTTNKKYRFYGDSVMSWASKYEEDIKQIENQK